MEECLQFLETSSDALPSDHVLCHWVRVQHIADEIGEQFSIEDPTNLNASDDIKIRFMVHDFDAQLQKCFSRTLNTPKESSMIFSEISTRLYLHEVALNAGNNNQDLEAPFTQESFRSMRPSQNADLSAGYIDSLSTSLTSINTLYNTFLSIPPTTVRCLPTFQFVRLAYITVVFIKLTAGDDDFEVEHCLDDIISLLKAAAQDNNQCTSVGKFSLILAMLRTLTIKHESQDIESGNSISKMKRPVSRQACQTFEESTVPNQSRGTYQSLEFFHTNQMHNEPSQYPSSTHSGVDMIVAETSEPDRDNSSPFLTPDLPLGSNCLSEVPDFDMVGGEHISTFLMDDDLLTSILASAPPDFFARFNKE